MDRRQFLTAGACLATSLFVERYIMGARPKGLPEGDTSGAGLLPALHHDPAVAGMFAASGSSPFASFKSHVEMRHMTQQQYLELCCCGVVQHGMTR